jgi:hypothetical protein
VSSSNESLALRRRNVIASIPFLNHRISRMYDQAELE